MKTGHVMKMQTFFLIARSAATKYLRGLKNAITGSCQAAPPAPALTQDGLAPRNLGRSRFATNVGTASYREPNSVITAKRMAA